MTISLMTTKAVNTRVSDASFTGVHLLMLKL